MSNLASFPFNLDDAVGYLQVSAINSYISFCSRHPQAPYVAIVFKGFAVDFVPISGTHDPDIENLYPNPFYGKFKEK